ncbi:MAG: hypothetical protein QOD86_2752 [Miltoncostaeaceae bacterium]|jgi:hypothetical protein|nr:hypothetical protein [Miltoncostaeaceae bacterium]
MGIVHTRRRRRKGPAKTVRFTGRGRFAGSRQLRLEAPEHGGAVTTRQASADELAALEARLASRPARTLTPAETVLAAQAAERRARRAARTSTRTRQAAAT